MRRSIVAAALMLAVAGCASPQADDDFDLDTMMLTGGRKQGAALDRALAEAAKHPLGSRENPIRVNMPPGQHAYLGRLRCSDGKAPQFGRVGNFGSGVFGSIIDGYRVLCATGEPRESMIFMDMYHPTHREAAAPPGFTLSPG